jgi:hypothetical protein
MKKALFLLILPVLFAISATAQDKIYKKKGTVLKVKILEVGLDEVKYRIFDDPNGPIYVIDKEQILKVEMEDGKTETYQTALTDLNNYTDHRKHALKVGFLAPLNGYLPITYERNLGVGKAVEFTLGIIGAGKNEVLYTEQIVSGQFKEIKRDQLGFHVAAGYKFNKLPTFFNRGVRMSHIMQGFYVRPTVNLGYYTDNGYVYKNTTPTTEKRNVAFGALTIDIGQQWVFANRFLLDLYVGFGYAFDNVNQDDWYDFAQDHFPIKIVGESDGLGVCSGFKVGWLIK